ncbi:MAG TPA: MerR family transcriptional regulator [Candidatus Ozemobacteraceae bacterium]|nr:MerR family transcriptional regulator [Candidatus Ozemobacteraceae bacterium]
MDKRYSIGELAEVTGVTRRTIRFYVQQGLLAPPEGAGRGHYYTDAHCRRLIEILRLQQAGLSLREIAGQQGAESESGRPVGVEQKTYVRKDAIEYYSPEPQTVPESWLRIVIAEGCEVQFQAGLCRLSPGRVDELRRAFLRIFPELSCSGVPGIRDDTV